MTARSAWSPKSLLRLILVSQAYRQVSRVTPEAQRLDADDRLLSRFPLRRLDAESIRDAMLAASGELDAQAGGPYVPTTRDGEGDIVVAESTAGSHRRSLYLQQRRTQVPGLLEVFDTPSIVINCTGRTPTTVPLQSLKLLNSEFVRARALGLAKRILAECTVRAQQEETRSSNLRTKDLSPSPLTSPAPAVSPFPGTKRSLLGSREGGRGGRPSRPTSHSPVVSPFPGTERSLLGSREGGRGGRPVIQASSPPTGSPVPGFPVPPPVRGTGTREGGRGVRPANPARAISPSPPSGGGCPLGAAGEWGITRAFTLVRSRAPSARELAEARAFLSAQTAEYAGQPDAEVRAWTDFCQALLASNDFLYLQ